MTLMPVPANDVLTLTSEDAMDNAIVEILNMEGRSMQTNKLSGYTLVLDVFQLATGNYILRIRTEDEEYSTRFNVVH